MRITWKRQLWQRQQLDQLLCWQQRQHCPQQKQLQQPWLGQQQKPQLQQQRELSLGLVQVQELLLFCHKQREQQRSQRSKREICSFEVPLLD